ncbi:hypothetical protein TrVE_jg2141 [Triparma verrucosa]|uniref:Uncharacterized protein n=1 Tax=Triparma verrucosa TaxID=1606542 RepID=A0A9W7ELD6_9STRA|nr:hypothetical protein TrVE_jg2141 [Triparma verrucosa]
MIVSVAATLVSASNPTPQLLKQTPSSNTTCSLTPAKAQLLAADLTKSLESSGYSVESAFANWFLPFDSSGPDNPDGTYMEYMFSQSDLPEHFCDVNFETCGADIPSDTYTQSTLLGPDDAIVFLGCSPPPSSYFASDMIVSSRFMKTVDPSIPAPDPDNLSRDDDYWWPGVPFNDALNMLLMDDFEWLSPLTMIQSFNSKTTSDVKEAIKERSTVKFGTGVQELNSTYVKMFSTRATEDFLDALPDSFRPLVRWSLPHTDRDGDLVQDYFSQKWPVLVVRKEPEDPKNPANLYAPTVTSRVTGNGEQGLNSSIAEAITNISKSLAEGFNFTKSTPYCQAQADNYLPGEMDDYVTALNDPSYGGDYLPTQDAVYGNPPDVFRYDDPPMLGVNSIGVMTGVMHTQFGTTIYNNIGLMDIDVVWSKWVNNYDLEKCPSAVHKDIFQIFFTHVNATNPTINCDDGSVIPTECCFVVDPPEDMYPITEPYPVAIGERSYLNPDTKTGPDFDEIIGVTLTLHH